MNIKDIFKRITALLLMIATVLNYGDFSFLSCFSNLVKTEAAEKTLTSGIVIDELESKLVKERKWLDGSNTDFPVTDSFWHDTSNDWVYRIDTSKVKVDNTKTGNAYYGRRIISWDTTKYPTINDVIKTDETDDSYKVSNNVYSGVDEPTTISEDNIFYSLKYDATLVGKNTANGDDSNVGGWYRNYYVSTADELKMIMYKHRNNFTYSSTKKEGCIRATKDETPDEKMGAYKVGVELLCDIDMGGKSGKEWSGILNNTRFTFEINGNGHHLYNGYYNSGAFFVNDTKDTSTSLKAIVHDVVFSNQHIRRSGGIFGSNVEYLYLDNVDFVDCIAQGVEATTIVVGNVYDEVYINNCMARNCYVIGNGKGHCAVFASYNTNKIDVCDNDNSTYIDDSTAATQYYYTDIPESDTGATDESDTDTGYTAYEKFEQCYIGATVTYNGVSKKLSTTFPVIFKNSMVIDSTVFELNETASHSGTFVACTQGATIFKNCFTNSEIYAQSRGGVFMGCCIGSGYGFYCDVEGTKTFVNTYFENCYTSGLLEGTSYEGGFVGSVFNDFRTGKKEDYSAEVDKEGICVFKNCYSTSSVGMQYSGEYVGGFVGLVMGNVGYDSSSTDPHNSVKGGNIAHKFINCYAAGEVGGIATVVTTDDSNTNSIGGFAGSYIIRDWKETYSTNDKPPVYTGDDRFNYIPIEATNCYYDKQTTAMRERDIGNYTTTTTSYPHNQNSGKGAVSGITGVYTQKSYKKGVKGLTDDVNMNDSAWGHTKGYYPYLKCFINEDKGGSAESNFGESKAITSDLYTKASVATVFLDHWDTKMDDSGNIVENTDETIYDTVRDISSKFEFTSGGNSDATNLGWQVADVHNEENSFYPYVGGYSFDTGTATGIKIDFTYYADKSTEETTTLTKTYTQKVIEIDTEQSGDDYIFKCSDFAEGKQFVKVTACNKDEYNEWKKNEAAYFDYVDSYNTYSVLKTSYINFLNQTKDYNGLSVNSTDTEIQQKLEGYLQSKLNVTKNGEKGTTDTDTVIGRVKAIQAIYESFTAGGKLDADDRANLIFYLSKDSTVADSDLKSAAAEYMRYNMDYYPFKAPEVVIEPTEFDSYAKDRYGIRYLRLIPTAYLNAGNIINVKVSDNRNVEGGELANKVTVDGVTMSKFDHTIGVLYSSAQAKDSDDVKTTLGDAKIYQAQEIVQKSAIYYTSSKNTFTGNNSKFALYDYFPTKSSIIGDDNAEEWAGLGSLINQVSWGNFHSGNGAEDGNGKTMVKVYSTAPEYADNTQTTYVLAKQAEVDMTVEANREKWSGTTCFEPSDKGYYYMVYYWRMNDGRYLEETKLVNISSSQFDMNVRTGVASASKDSFVYDSNGDVSYTAVDCDVVSGSEKSMESYNFPSDLFKSQTTYTEWDEYAKNTYSEYGGQLTKSNVDYWYKARSAVIYDSAGYVAWRKSSDYALVKLIVEVKDGNDWYPMSVDVENNGNEKYLINDDAKVTYNYTYNSYSVTQNPDTKQFSVVVTSNSVKSFRVEMSRAVNNGYVHYIKFNFLDDSGQNTSEFNDDIRVTALFKKISAQIEADEDVYIDDSKSLTDLGKGQSLYTAQEYRSVDNYGITDVNDKKAVLFGDKLIFCKRITNTGIYAGSNITVTEEVPTGIKLDESSIKVYKQSKSISYGDEDSYNNLEECVLVGDGTNYADEFYSAKYDSATNTITWVINPVVADTDYYAVFEGTAVSSDGDIDYDVEQHSYSSKSNFGSIFINGDVPKTSTTTSESTSESTTESSDDENRGDYNINYNNVANFKVVTEDTANTGGSMHRKVTITCNNSSNYELKNIHSDLNKCSVSNITVSCPSLVEAASEATTTDTYFEISLSGTLTSGESIVLEYDLTPYGDVTYGDTVAINYVDSSNASTVLQNSLRRLFNSTTNTVTADARWLYMDIVKNISAADSGQAFVFKVDNGDSDYILTDVYCDSSTTNDDNTTTYYGKKTVLITERGNYTVTETDWANTDYEVKSAKYSITDIDLSNAGGDGITAAATQTKDNNNDGNDDSVYLPRAMYTSTAIPMWLTDSTDGNPTVTCTNTLSDYAWLSSQTNVENSFSESDTTSSSGTTSQEDTTPASVPQTASLEVVTEEKKDDEE